MISIEKNMTPRLLNIAKLINKGDILADIGTDHGYLPVYLIEKGIIEKGIASDINMDPLKKAKSLIENKKLENKIETRISNGLENYFIGEIDAVVIAGMGGHLISEIIRNNFNIVKKLKYLVLQPMTGIVELRKFLYENNFRISEELIAKEGKKFYQIIKVEIGKEKRINKPIEFEISRNLIDSTEENLIEFLEYKLKKVTNIISEIEENSKDIDREKLGQFKENKREIRELIDYVSKKNNS